MRLISLKLKNIRSYTNQELHFPEGTVLLSGDIGSGKSTILLAIEFALFGVLRGELSGNALLRNGAIEGYVELTFAINGTNYGIKRTLKRTRTSVDQEAGAFFVNGLRKEGTAIELKSQILELLGYPSELLTKSKNLVYRYTVYTPQEEMKRILMEDRETRVAILRKVFDIDKYERIRQNAGVYTKILRERKKAYETLLTDFEEKKQLVEKAKQEKELAEQAITVIEPKLEAAKAKLAQLKAQLKEIEETKQKAELLSRELQLNKTHLYSKVQQHALLLNEMNQLTGKLKQEVQPPSDVSQTSQRILNLNQILPAKEKNLREFATKLAEYNAFKKQAAELSTKISSLAQCPTCLQDVTSDHKKHILTTQQSKIVELDVSSVGVNEQSRQMEQEITQIKKELEELRQQEKESAVLNVKYLHYQELTKKKTALETQAKQLQEEANKYTTRAAELEAQVKPLEEATKIYEKLRKEVDASAEEERELSIQHATVKQKEQHIMQTLNMLEKELEKKRTAKSQLEQTQKLHQWLSDYFAPLMEVMERHVMAKIHYEFSALFQKWFGMLVDENIMTGRLDETFTPLIQQNGYDIEVDHLSGGERTACALAYRLALNKTINSLINTIKTKDLLILDEPTDGFSAEQLDKMKDVLDELSLRQIVIVSHEQKIESLADMVLRVQKSEHVSQVI